MTYFVGLNRKKLYNDLPVISLITDPDNLFDAEKGMIKPNVIELGLTDVIYAEVIDGLREGEQVISEFITSEKSSSGGGRPPM